MPNNPGLLEKPKATRILSERIVVTSAGTPVRLPYGKPVGEVRVSTAGNTGNVYLGTSYVEAKDDKHRFTIATGNNILLPIQVNDLSELWLDAANDNDAMSIFGEVESVGG